MDTTIDRTKPPSQLLLALEVRGIWELQAFFAAYPLLRRAPRGDGHPVLVLPGLAASDISTRPLRAYLKAQGYAAHGWKQGQNRGPRDGVEAAIHIYKHFGVRSMFATAHSDRQTRARGQEANPLGWVAKPYSPAGLVAEISAHFDD